MKTSSAFKLSKTAKRALAIITDPQKCGEWKKALVNAEASSQIPLRRGNKEKSL